MIPTTSVGCAGKLSRVLRRHRYPAPRSDRIHSGHEKSSMIEAVKADLVRARGIGTHTAAARVSTLGSALLRSPRDLAVDGGGGVIAPSPPRDPSVEFFWSQIPPSGGLLSMTPLCLVGATLRPVVVFGCSSSFRPGSFAYRSQHPPSRRPEGLIRQQRSGGSGPVTRRTGLMTRHSATPCTFSRVSTSSLRGTASRTASCPCRATFCPRRAPSPRRERITA